MIKIKWGLLSTVIFISMVAKSNYTFAAPGRGEIVYPGFGETITDTAPMITFMLPQPVVDAEAPVTVDSTTIDLDSVKIYLDGADITAETQLSMEYVFFTPQNPLALGVHNVKVTYEKNVAGTQLLDGKGNPAPPLNWSFRIATQAVIQPASSVRAGQTVSTSGSYTIKVKDVYLNNANRTPAINETSSSDIIETEGLKTTGSYDFNHSFYGKSLTGHYDRAVETINGRSADNFNLKYLDRTFEMQLGDYYVTANDFSELTINGVRMRGLLVKNQIDKRAYYTYFAGRSQEPQDFRMKKYTYGSKMDYKLTDSHILKITALKTEDHDEKIKSVQNVDNIFSIKDFYTYSPNLRINAEAAMSRRAVKPNPSNANMTGKDVATKLNMTYKPGQMYTFDITHRNIGPEFNPTYNGSYSETDRQGNSAKFSFAPPSRKITLYSLYDVYHNNVHLQKPDRITDIYHISNSGITLDYPSLPTINLLYNKQYIGSKGKRASSGVLTDSETTMASLSLSKNLNDFKTLVGNSIRGTTTRSDSDRVVTSYSITSSRYRSDSKNLQFQTGYKGFAKLTFNSILTRSYGFNMSSGGTPTRTTTTDSDMKSNTDNYSLQLNIIPFVFQTNINVRRTASKYYTTDSFGKNVLSSLPLDNQISVTMSYALKGSKKLLLTFVDYDKQFRTQLDKNRTYDEKTLELGYTTDF